MLLDRRYQISNLYAEYRRDIRHIYIFIAICHSMHVNQRTTTQYTSSDKLMNGSPLLSSIYEVLSSSNPNQSQLIVTNIEHRTPYVIYIHSTTFGMGFAMYTFFQLNIGNISFAYARSSSAADVDCSKAKRGFFVCAICLIKSMNVSLIQAVSSSMCDRADMLIVVLG